MAKNKRTAYQQGNCMSIHTATPREQTSSARLANTATTAFSSRRQMWLHVLRLRTLPLSVAGIVVANVLAWVAGDFYWLIALFSLSTALLLQIVANVANDYGDGINQMDRADRQGPVRLTASGLVSSKSMLLLVLTACTLAILSGLALLYSAWHVHNQMDWSFWIALGSLSIVAALAYTVGAKPYGYRGMGDLAVLIFFGFVAVLGTMMLQSNQADTVMQWPALCAGSALGLWSVAVLNVNNMRDIETDAQHGKITVAVRLGLAKAVRYEQVLLLSASFSWFGVLFAYVQNWLVYFLYGLTLLFLWRHLRFPWRQASAGIFTQKLQDLSRDVLVQVIVFTVVLLISH